LTHLSSAGRTLHEIQQTPEYKEYMKEYMKEYNQSEKYKECEKKEDKHQKDKSI
jgi:hypothetical protein